VSLVVLSEGMEAPPSFPPVIGVVGRSPGATATVFSVG